MKTVRYVHWKEEDMWLGYLEDYPEYMTQGVTLDELQDNLKGIYDELSSCRIPAVRKVAELQVA